MAANMGLVEKGMALSSKMTSKAAVAYQVLAEKALYSTAVLPFLSYMGSLWLVQKMFKLKEEEVGEVAKRALGPGMFASLLATAFAAPYFTRSPAEGVAAWAFLSSAFMPFVVVGEAFGRRQG